MTRTTLTKSLHTVSAVTAVALLMIEQNRTSLTTHADAIRAALRVLGQPHDWSDADPVFAACVAKLQKMRPKVRQTIGDIMAMEQRAN